ncbi:MAG: RiPP maturation radical SAM C-methyltransferase [Thermoguttaceae bacterium]|jgi:ribosomal peptide maturation radical SAM protein 1|nr:RiPP maturation radical SAM C-methyltransferase [Thermoguttaceae bacterium]
MSPVLLVQMPFANLRWPSLALGLLKAALRRHGIGCDVAYLNFDFAETVGLDTYQWLADQFAFVLGGERLFAKHLFPGAIGGDDAYYREVLRSADRDFNDSDRREFESVAAHVGPFLDRCMNQFTWEQYGVIGFTTTLQQTLPSLCLARRIRQRAPHAKLAFGGAACEAEMGLELLSQFPEIDYVFLGEADHTFPEVVAHVLNGADVELPPGVAARDDLTGALPPACCEIDPRGDVEQFVVRDLDALPFPDFDDYFARLERSPLKPHIDPLLFAETSRGCWWGERRQCAFCGLNGAAIGFRSKSPQRALDELRHLAERYGVRRFAMADNILDRRYFDTLLPMLRQSGLNLAFEYEMRSSLSRRQIDTLIGAGLGAAQLGIESFSTPILKLLGKGVRAIDNLQTLKWFTEAGVEVKWNLLWGIPGEDPADYQAMADLVPAIVHFAPPIAVGRVRADRFSPYFREPERYGIQNLRPHRAFRFVYPLPDDSLRRLAHYFEHDPADGCDPRSYVGPLLDAVEHWQTVHHHARLSASIQEDDTLVLSDTRPCAAVFQHRLRGMERELYRYCDKGRSFDAVAKFALGARRNPLPNEQSLRRLLADWIDARWIVRIDERYLALAVCVAGWDGP